MTESGDIGSLTGDLNTRLGEKFGLKRGSLEQRMKKAGRRLPGRVHRDAAVIGAASALAAHPKLRKRVDQAGAAAAHRRIAQHLETVNPKERRTTFLLGMLAGLAFNLLLLAALTVGFLMWRGLI